MKKKKKQAFKIPEYFLRQMEEFTGGYLIFAYNENGQPDIYANFDNPAAGMGMHSFVKNWANAMDEAHKAGMLHSIIKNHS